MDSVPGQRGRDDCSFDRLLEHSVCRGIVPAGTEEGRSARGAGAVNPYDLDERLREVDDAEVRHESEESARRALAADPDAEDGALDDGGTQDRDQPADD